MHRYFILFLTNFTNITTQFRLREIWIWISSIQMTWTRPPCAVGTWRGVRGTSKYFLLKIYLLANIRVCKKNLGWTRTYNVGTCEKGTFFLEKSKESSLIYISEERGFRNLNGARPKTEGKRTTKWLHAKDRPKSCNAKVKWIVWSKGLRHS